MHNAYKKVIAFWLIPLFAFLQIFNIYLAIFQMKGNSKIFQTIIKQISEDSFICRSDTTVVYYLFRELYKFNLIHTILLSGILIGLCIYYFETHNKAALLFLTFNIVLYFITAVPFILEKLFGAVIKLTIYDFAFLTADYRNVPAIIAVYVILTTGYILFFISCAYNYFKSRK
jgi:hypothetical protein